MPVSTDSSPASDVKIILICVFVVLFFAACITIYAYRARLTGEPFRVGFQAVLGIAREGNYYPSSIAVMVIQAVRGTTIVQQPQVAAEVDPTRPPAELVVAFEAFERVIVLGGATSSNFPTPNHAVTSSPEGHPVDLPSNAAHDSLEAAADSPSIQSAGARQTQGYAANPPSNQDVIEAAPLAASSRPQEPRPSRITMRDAAVAARLLSRVADHRAQNIGSAEKKVGAEVGSDTRDSAQGSSTAVPAPRQAQRRATTLLAPVGAGEEAPVAVSIAEEESDGRVD